MPTIASEIHRYLKSGQSDPMARAWPQPTVLARTQAAKHELRTALIAELHHRCGDRRPPADIDDEAARALVLARVEPMVRGLFPADEQETVLAAVATRVVFLTAGRIEQAIRTASFDSNAWSIANTYLVSVGAKPLAPSHAGILGLSTDQACYVTAQYLQLACEHDDYVVHEVAHSFPDCHCTALGLQRTERRKYPLDIHFAHHETFAYACEFYACIARAEPGRKGRLARLDALARTWTGNGQHVEPALVTDILRQAIHARDGWRVIRMRCRSDEAARMLYGEASGLGPGGS